MSLPRMKLSVYKYNACVVLECRVKTERISKSLMHDCDRISKILFVIQIH